MHTHIIATEKTGYDALFDFFKKLDINNFHGVTGGGVIHFLKYISPSPSSQPYFMTLAEYSAGFAPLGSYLTTGKIAAGVATLGAATKLLACGLSDAKLHDIPAVYIVPAYDESLSGKASLQDPSVYGSNVIEQLKAECPTGLFVFDDPNKINQQLANAEQQLKLCKPVVFVIIHSALSQFIPDNSLNKDITIAPAETPVHNLNKFIQNFKQASQSKKITILIGEEMARYADSKHLVNQLSEKLKSYLIWSMNGANAVDHDNPYGYGYLGFGGNDLASNHFKNMNSNDTLLVLGACPDEYTMNLANFTAGDTFYCTNIQGSYGQLNNSFEHRADHNYEQINYPLSEFILEILKPEHSFENIHAPMAPQNLNTRTVLPPKESFTNMEHFYLALDKWWPKNSITFSDVCLAYKDRQYITQRPNNNVDFYSLYRGSAMGYVLGAAIGSKVADREKNVFAFTGDGCFKLFAGSLAEAANLGITLFVLDNSMFSIVEQGLQTILPDTPPEFWHADVKPIDYCLLAQACGWRSAKLNIDLSNLNELLDGTLNQSQSLLIEVKVDPHQLLGRNPRAHNL